MQHIGEILTARGPSAEEVEIRTHVYELAHAWKAGTLPLVGVRSASTSKERFTAVRFSQPGEDKEVLLELVDALIEENERNEMQTDHGYITTKALSELDYLGMTDHEGNRVWVSPVHYINGAPKYPDPRIAPGQEKQAANEKLDAEYREHRRKRKEESGRQ